MTQESNHQIVETVSFGGGCFWCIEAVLQRVDGVLEVTSGYQGGHTRDPSYQDVCSGQTGHAEVVQVKYDPSTVSFEALLELFWQAHDPTQLNRQGPDVGTQYRSAVYTTTEDQLQTALAAKQRLNDENAFGKPMMTEIKPAETFYPAENYHQDYYNTNRRAPYCLFNIAPKLKKLGMK